VSFVQALKDERTPWTVIGLAHAMRFRSVSIATFDSAASSLSGPRSSDDLAGSACGSMKPNSATTFVARHAAVSARAGAARTP